MLLICFSQGKISEGVLLLPSHKAMQKQSRDLCACARRKVCVCVTGRDKTEQDGKRSAESRDENKIEFGEKNNFPMTSVLFLTSSKQSCTPRLEAGLAHSIEEGKGKTKKEWRAEKKRKDKEKTTFYSPGRREVKYSPGTWESPVLGEEPLQLRWIGAQRLCRRRVHLSPPLCPTQFLPLPLAPPHRVS